MALIIGFGAESLIADVITGLFMIFENQYNVGDIIELDGYRGTVVNIAIRTTSIEDSGGNIKIFNNSDVRNIINLSADSSRAVCDIPIPYEADIDKAEKVVGVLCQELVKEYPEVFKQAPECVGVQALADSAVVLRVVAQVEEENRFSAGRLINKKMKSGLEKAGMGAPYAQIVVHKSN
jgi:small conductance mechanosensitive channel